MFVHNNRYLSCHFEHIVQFMIILQCAFMRICERQCNYIELQQHAKPLAIRKNPPPQLYTTNAIESLNMSLRKVTKNRGHFPSDEAMFKLLYLALKNIAKKWTMPIRDWKSALNQFSIMFEERLPNF